jgi:hypothetical protein
MYYRAELWFVATFNQRAISYRRRESERRFAIWLVQRDSVAVVVQMSCVAGTRMRQERPMGSA